MLIWGAAFDATEFHITEPLGWAFLRGNFYLVFSFLMDLFGLLVLIGVFMSFLLAVRRAGRTGGTFLHTSRTNPSKVRAAVVPAHLKDKYSAEVNDLTPEVLANLDFLGIESRSLNHPDGRYASATLQQLKFSQAVFQTFPPPPKCIIPALPGSPRQRAGRGRNR